MYAMKIYKQTVKMDLGEGWLRLQRDAIPDPSAPDADTLDMDVLANVRASLIIMFCTSPQMQQMILHVNEIGHTQFSVSAYYGRY